MTTFTTQDLTTEQQVALQKHEEMHTMVNTIIERQSNWVDPSPLPQPPAPPTIESIITNICAQLQLLTSVIKEGQGNSQAGENSLQECVSTTLQQAEWFKEMVDEKAEELVDDKDFDYQIESAVESHFSNSFSLDDHVDITAEVESKVEDIAEDLLKDIVEERLEEIVRNKLQNIRITFD
jgi:hypothetical protein